MVIEDFSAQPNQHNCVINMVEHLTFSLMFTACLFCGGEVHISTHPFLLYVYLLMLKSTHAPSDQTEQPHQLQRRPDICSLSIMPLCAAAVCSAVCWQPECNEEHEKLGCLNIQNILNWPRNPSNRSAWASCLLPECVGWWVWPAHAPPSCPRCGAMPWLPPSPVGWHTQHRQDRA